MTWFIKGGHPSGEARHPRVSGADVRGHAEADGDGVGTVAGAEPAEACAVVGGQGISPTGVSRQVKTFPWGSLSSVFGSPSRTIPEAVVIVDDQ